MLINSRPHVDTRTMLVRYFTLEWALAIQTTSNAAVCKQPQVHSLWEWPRNIRKGYQTNGVWRIASVQHGWQSSVIIIRDNHPWQSPVTIICDRHLWHRWQLSLISLQYFSSLNLQRFSCDPCWAQICCRGYRVMASQSSLFYNSSCTVSQVTSHVRTSYKPQP